MNIPDEAIDAAVRFIEPMLAHYTAELTTKTMLEAAAPHIVRAALDDLDTQLFDQQRFLITHNPYLSDWRGGQISGIRYALALVRQAREEL